MPPRADAIDEPAARPNGRRTPFAAAWQPRAGAIDEPAARPNGRQTPFAAFGLSLFNARCNICLGHLGQVDADYSTVQHFAERPQEQEQRQQRARDRTEGAAPTARRRLLCAGCSSLACRQGLSHASLTAVVWGGVAAHVMAAYWIVGSSCLYACAVIAAVAIRVTK
jgi:hypothetical protein